MSTLYPDLNLTNFPNSLDEFMSWLNVVATDGPLIQQYQQAVQQGNMTTAATILAQIPSGTRKIVTATDLNKLSQAILAIERFYSTDIEGYVDNLQESWLNVIQQFSYQGVWSSGTTYERNNMVLYTVNGLQLIFLAIQNPPVATVPTNTQYWRVLTVQGQSGESGVGISYREEWNNVTNYETDDAVTYNGALWMALQNNSNIEPNPTNITYWRKIMDLTVTTYPIQATQPTNLQTGGLWFNTSDNPTGYYNLDPLTNPAQANQIVEGYQAYGSTGSIITGTLTGVTLPPLSNPANASQIVSGYQVYNDEGVPITGTMPSKTAQTFTPSTSNQTISAGQYLSGTQTILGDTDLVPGNIRSGVNIFGVVGTYAGGGSSNYSYIDTVSYSNQQTITFNNIPTMPLAFSIWATNQSTTSNGRILLASALVQSNNQFRWVYCNATGVVTTDVENLSATSGGGVNLYYSYTGETFTLGVGQLRIYMFDGQYNVMIICS